MSGYKFGTAIDLEVLMHSGGFWREESAVKKIATHSDLTDLDRNLSNEILQKVNILKHAVVNMSNGDFSADDAGNVIAPIIAWIKINSRKTSNPQLLKSLKNLYLMACSTLAKVKDDVEKLEKVGLPGRSGRKKGYKFEEHEHPRAGGGKFASKTEKEPQHPAEHIYTGAGRRLPSYRTEHGKRVGRGITSVPSDFGPAAVRMAGHIGSGVTEQLFNEPLKAAQLSSGNIRSSQARQMAQVESLKTMIADPMTPSSVKAKAINTMENIRRGWKTKYGSTQDPSAITQLRERTKAGIIGYAKEAPYSAIVGAVQGALRGMVERFRTSPVLAPLDIRVRPDILNSGLRTAVATLRDRKMERVADIINSAKSQNRHLTVEEYGTIASLSNMNPQEKQRVRTMAEGLQYANDPDEAEQISGVLDDFIGANYAKTTVKQTMRPPVPKLRYARRAESKADLPIYNLGPQHREEAARRLAQLKGKK